MTDITIPSTQNQPKLSLVSKLLPLWIILAMVAGLLLGKFFPEFGKSLQPFIPIGLFLMIYPAMTKLKLGEIKSAAKEWKPAAIVIFF